MSSPQTDTRLDVLSVLIKDHRKVESLFAELESRQGTPDHRRQLTDVLTAELVRHSVAEEALVYPAVREALPDGDRIVEAEIAEHAEAERTLKELEDTPAAEPHFDQLLTHLISTIRHHIQEEESQLFPRLRAAYDQEELIKLADKVEATKKKAPTRPHPAAPDRPPANRVLAPGTGMMDRVRDAFSGRPTSMDQIDGS